MAIDTSMNNRRGGSILQSLEASLIGSDGSADGSYARQLAVTARRAEIRLHAYYRAERRGFVPGHELDDWLAAERQMSEIDAIREQESQRQIQT